ncbi:hypothetical protein [Sulfitobacter sp. SK012]|uniref:hypothetical protein n=1 Tax=Sulfitobacter sp. SK012 TaxID=1389005 RepID=UPI0013B3F83A|nr:hypothetical protein [Sulfitobacter sp. SK012]
MFHYAFAGYGTTVASADLQGLKKDGNSRKQFDQIYDCERHMTKIAASCGLNERAT